MFETYSVIAQAKGYVLLAYKQFGYVVNYQIAYIGKQIATRTTLDEGLARFRGLII